MALPSTPIESCAANEPSSAPEPGTSGRNGCIGRRIAIIDYIRVNRHRLAWLDIPVCMLLFGAFYAGRGFLLARWTDGRYLWSSACVDFLVMALVVLVLRLLDLGVKGITHRVFGDRTPARKRWATATNWAIVLAIAGPFLMALVQFHPQRIACSATPAQWGMPYTEVTLQSEGLRLPGWHIPASSPDRPVVLIAHGLGANKQNFLPAVQIVHELDYNAFIFDFRGHGDSEGRTITFGLKESADVRAAYEYVVQQHPRSRIYGLGYSMGASALARMASDDMVFDKIVLDSTFARAETAARNSLLRYGGPLQTPAWHLGRFWGWVFTGVDIAQHQPEAYVANLASRPLLLIHGTSDVMLPAGESVRLHEVAGPRSQLWLIENAGHIETMQHPDYKQRLRRFFEEEP